MNLNCLVCGGIFTEWDAVECDGCRRITHRESCGDYTMITRATEDLAYFFCEHCWDAPDEDEQ